MSLESKVAVLPAGVWGATWALGAAKQGHDIRLYIRNADDCRRINKDRIYRKVSGVVFPTNITAFNDSQETLDGAEVVVLAPSSLGYREFVRSLEGLNRGQYILNLTKGLEIDTGFRMSEILEQEHPGILNQLAVWSGPNIASKIASEESANAHIASVDPNTAFFFERSFGRIKVTL